MPHFSLKKFSYACCAFLLVIYSEACTQQKNDALQSVSQKPVFDKDFPDPTIVKAGDTYYAYATQSWADNKMLNIQVASSTDLQQWSLVGDALPLKPSWASTTQDFWAPHVLYDDSLKQYVLFYSGESDDPATGKCIGVAFSDKPTGPFTDMGHPLVVGAGFVNIDPMVLVDPVSKKKLLYWGSGFDPLRVQELSADYKSFAPGTIAKTIMMPRLEKDYTNLIEGAWVDVMDGKYYLYYSGDNCCGDKAKYAVMIAKANDPFGPFVRLGEANQSGNSVILEKDKEWIAPGHNSIIRDDKDTIWIAYHAINKKEREQNGSKERRVMLINQVLYKNGWPTIIKKQ